jgi:hypothetical protein
MDVHCTKKLIQVIKKSKSNHMQTIKKNLKHQEI